ncbi:MAG: response regulator [Cyclobacteriaceae bacterium]|nr:response regulator [Cyclobacteriaceae bacterium]
MKNTNIDILLIEDSPHDAEMSLRALKKNKIANDIIHLTNGAQVLNFLFGLGEFEGRDVDNKPKLILLDLKMPKIDGIEVLQKIKQNESTKRIPVVVLTSSKENPDIQKCYDLGANSYLVKPVDFNSFIRSVTDSGMYWMLLNQLPY